jgi:hypothetical protein
MLKYVDRLSEKKALNNSQICDMIREHCGSDQINAIVLDGRYMRTSKTLLKAFGESDAIRVVVPEMSTHAKQRIRCEKRIDVRRGCKLEDLLLGLGRTRGFNVAYFDYCGTITGDRANDVFPLEDIQLFLKRVATRKQDVVFACTFAVRNSLGFTSTDAVEAFLKPLFVHCHFRPKVLDQRLYRQLGARGAQMLFVCSVLRFDASLAKEAKTAEFVCRKRGRGFEGYRN